MINIGERLKYFRKLRGITGNQLAEMLNVTQSQISRYENNQNLPTIHALLEICQILNVTLSDFFAGDEPTMPPDLLQLIETAKKLTPEERKALTLFLQSSLERNVNNEQ